MSHRAGDALLTVSAVVGVGCALVFVVGMTCGARPLIFRSGSMAPGIPIGSLGLVRSVPAEAVRVGDVVSVPYGETRVTHRVVGVQQGSGPTVLRLKGDANEVADPQPYAANDVQRLWFSVPVLGGVVAWLSRPPGVYVLVLYAGLMFMLVRRPPGEPPGEPPARTPRRPRAIDQGVGTTEECAGGRLALRAGVMSTALLAFLVAATPHAGAAWADGVTVAGTSLSTFTMVAPTIACANTSSLPQISWSAPAGPTPTRYSVSYTGASSSGTDSTTSTSWQPSPSGIVIDVYTVDVRSVIGTWSSAASNQVRFSVTKLTGKGGGACL